MVGGADISSYVRSGALSKIGEIGFFLALTVREAGIRFLAVKCGFRILGKEVDRWCMRNCSLRWILDALRKTMEGDLSA